MSQQLQITGGAKVRSLEGVITGTTGVLGSLPINASNGIPQLDSNGKILVSQLPNSVMEYKGTWNAATNTPTLADGTGNQGDVYLCNVAGTVNFGSGPIAFVVGDQVIYSGTVWQRASGATGTVTSVAVTESGDALSITGSPITTSGTINIGFAGTSAQYVAGDGSLITFPTIVTQAQNLVTEVYNETGATLTKGTVVYINGGHGNLPTVTKALATSDATSAQTYGVIRADITNNNNGYVTVIGNLDNLDTQAYAAGTQLYLSSTTAGAWTSTKQYAPAHLVYVGIVTRSHPTQGVVEIKIQNGFELDELHNVSAQTPSNNQGIFYNSSTSLWENKSIDTALGYTPVPTSRTLTINGTSYDLSANRSWTIDSMVYPSAGIAVSTGTAWGTSITDNSSNWNTAYSLRITSATSPLSITSNVLSISQASGSTNGYLSSTDWTTFNNKQNALTNPVTGTGVSGRIAYFNGTTTQTSSAFLTWDNTNAILSANSIYNYNNTTNAYMLSSDGENIGSIFNVSITKWALGYGTSTTALGTPVLTWDSSANVGIGTTSPTSKLHIVGATYSTLGFFVPNTSQISFTTSNGSNGMNVNGSTNKVVFMSGGNETITLDSSANVGIGTTSPSYKLDVSGTGRFSGTSSVLNINGGGTSTMYQTFNTTGGNYYIGISSSTGTGLLSGASAYSMAIVTESARDLIFGTNNTTRLTIASTGAATFSSSVTAGASFLANTASVVNYALGSAGANFGQIFPNGSTAWSLGYGGSSSTIGSAVLTWNSSGNVSIGGLDTSEKLNIVSGNIKLYSYQYTAGDYRYIGSEYAQGNGNNRAEVRFGIDTTGDTRTYLGFATTSVGGSITERMRINSVGNVGIGTSSPVTVGSYQTLTLNGPSGAGAYMSFGVNGAQQGAVYANSSGLSLETTTANPMSFWANGSERMRITSGGTVCIGRTSAPSSAYKAAFQEAVMMAVTANTNNMVNFFNQSDTYVASIVVNASTVAYGTGSDYRLKEDFKDFNGLDKVTAIKVYDFKFKEAGDRMEGVIAHELQKILPYAVSGKKDEINDDGTPKIQNVDYSKIVPVLVKAIQEQQAQIEELKAKIK
jgi:hypothetical protein